MRTQLAVLFAVALLGCGGNDNGARDTSHTGALRVHSVNYPLAAFAERIGGDVVTVSFPVPQGTDPAFWNPTPEEIARFADADLILLNGAGYAKWTRMASLPASRTIDTSRNFKDQLIPMGGQVSHTHGPEGDHAHGETAFTVWLDPTLAVDQARSIAAALRARRPNEAARFETNLVALEKELGELDQSFRDATRALGTEPVLFSHPVYQYLERRYALNGRSLHWEPSVDPGPSGWQALEKLLAEHPSRLMIWEGEPAAPTRTRLQEMGIRCVVLDPCGKGPASGDYFSAMRDNVERLRSSP